MHEGIQSIVGRTSSCAAGEGVSNLPVAVHVGGCAVRTSWKRAPCCCGCAPPALFVQEAAVRAEIKSLVQNAQQHRAPYSWAFFWHRRGWKICKDKHYAVRGRLLAHFPLPPTVIARAPVSDAKSDASCIFEQGKINSVACMGTRQQGNDRILMASLLQFRMHGWFCVGRILARKECASFLLRLLMNMCMLSSTCHQQQIAAAAATTSNLNQWNTYSEIKPAAIACHTSHFTPAHGGAPRLRRYATTSAWLPSTAHVSAVAP